MTTDQKVRGSTPLGRTICIYIGKWLNLVEHLVWDQGVAGSNPVFPTISYLILVLQGFYFFRYYLGTVFYKLSSKSTISSWIVGNKCIYVSCITCTVCPILFDNKYLVYDTTNGLGLWANGMILLDRSDKQSRQVTYDKMKYVLLIDTFPPFLI